MFLHLIICLVCVQRLIHNATSGVSRVQDRVGRALRRAAADKHNSLVFVNGERAMDMARKVLQP